MLKSPSGALKSPSGGGTFMSSERHKVTFELPAPDEQDEEQ